MVSWHKMDVCVLGGVTTTTLLTPGVVVGILGILT